MLLEGDEDFTVELVFGFCVFLIMFILLRGGTGGGSGRLGGNFGVC